MNKTLRFSLLSMLTMFLSTMFAQTKTAFVFTDLYGAATISDISKDPKTKDGITVSFAKGNSNNAPAYNKVGEVRLYGGKSNTVLDGCTMTVKSEGASISKIVLEAGSIGTIGELSANVGDITEDDKHNITWTGNATEVTFTASRLSTNPGAATQNRYKSATVTVTDGTSAKTPAGLSFSETELTTTIGETFTPPVLTKETTAEAVYTSSNTDVATVDAQTGEVTILAVGTTTISAETEENDDFYAGSASYTITVKNPVFTEVTLPYNETFATDQGSFVIDNVNIGELNYVWSHAEYDGNAYMKASAYANKKNNESESWLVSPTIDMTNMAEATLKFTQCINKYFGNVEDEATLWVKEENGEWIKQTIEYPAIPEKETFSSFEEQPVSLNAFAGKKIKIGFKYTSTDTTAGTWEINNISVTGVVTSIENIETETKNTNAPMYNLAGQRVNNTYKGIVIKNGKKFFNNK